MFAAYVRHGGRLPRCAFGLPELRAAYHEIPPDIAQYAPDFPNEVRQAIVNDRFHPCRAARHVLCRHCPRQ